MNLLFMICLAFTVYYVLVHTPLVTHPGDLSLKQDGITIIKNAVDINALEMHLNGDRLQYERLFDYASDLTHKYMPGMIPSKIRFSNNSNSTDASHFHTDLNVYHGSLPQDCSFYTMITHLDGGYFDFIPQSKGYLGRRRVFVNKGDLVIFNALTLFHKGYFPRNTRRRLLQIFEVSLPACKANVINMYSDNHGKWYGVHKAAQQSLSSIPVINSLWGMLGYTANSLNICRPSFCPPTKEYDKAYSNVTTARARKVDADNLYYVK